MKKTLSIALVLILALSVLAGCAPAEPVEVETKVEPTNEVEEAVVETNDAEVSGLTTEEVASLLDDPTALLVDTRSTYAFNGWKLGGEMRGGHITGATVFSASWLNKLENNEAIQAELDRYGISKDKMIVTYGNGTESATAVADKLVELGYDNVEVYADGVEAWAAEGTLEMSSMPNYEYLVHPEWVKSGLADNSIKVYEVSWGEGDNYKKSHIPGAAHINTDDFEEGPLWNRRSDADIEKAVLSNGITKDMTVVLYGDDTTPPARIALMLKYAGVEDVRILDGGFQAWKDANLEVAKGGVDKTSVEAFGVAIPQHPEYIIDMPEAKDLLADENGRLVSIRSWVEYTGETSGYDYIEAAGRIDGAVYGFAGSDPWHMEDYRTPDNTMVNYEFMADRWAKQDITMSNTNAFYCGTGWRASETWFYALAMDWKNVSVYDGGWKEWSETDGNPVATGEPKSK